MIRSVLIVLLLTGITHVRLSSQTNNFEKNLATAASLVNVNELSRALLTIEDILIKKPDYLPAQELKIDILTQMDREKDALRDVEEYIRMYPDKAEFLYLRGILRLQKQKY